MDTLLSEPIPDYEPPPRLTPWVISNVDFAIFVSLTLAAIFAGAAVGTLLGGQLLGEQEGDASTLLVIIATIVMQACGLGAFVLFRKVFNQPVPNTPLPVFDSVMVGLKWLLISYIAVVGVSLVVTSALEWLGFPKEQQEPVKMMLDGGTTLERWLMYFSVIVVAPVCEEAIFRGGIFRFLFGRFPLSYAAPISGTLFALMHFNLYSFAPLLVLGIGLALAYRESGSLVSSIVLHASFNLTTTLVIIYFPDAA